ncbi:hypothetical protein [Neolewinella persica]|uniref:hypothetical protein n=1 Tax=Neolewinella persica TaxID=70998 RepID=UPI00037AAFBF|nr:hypothetical protein [Neolewinella persica]
MEFRFRLPEIGVSFAAIFGGGGDRHSPAFLVLLLRQKNAPGREDAVSALLVSPDFWWAKSSTQPSENT